MAAGDDWDRKSDGFRLQTAGKNMWKPRFPQDFPSHLEPFKFEVVNSGLKTRVKKKGELYPDYPDL